MRQVIQHQKTGKITVEDLPPPLARPGYILVRNVASVISAGTERSSVKTAQASLLGKARARPDLVRQVLENVKREGVWATIQKVRNRLDNYKELGYSSAGIVIASDSPRFAIGDRVACAGAGYAVHAEIVAVPKNLVCPIPDPVSFEEAAFTTLGAIAIQGVRQAKPQVGETVAVIGLGLLGLLTVQILKAAGCRVIGIDRVDNNFELATTLGCDVCYVTTDSTADRIHEFTKGIGTDAVIITASTPSNQPLNLAVQIARPRSVIAIVGVIGMTIPRSPFYEKELNITIACSYGPGRYDPLYEELGIDYPIGHVRWTENRNMQAFLDLLAAGSVRVTPLITHRVPIEQAQQAYQLITGERKEPYIGILLTYPERHDHPRRYTPPAVRSTRAASSITIGFIGAGNFAQSYLLPPLKSHRVTLRGVATLRPVSAKAVAEKFGFAYGTTDPEEVLNDPDINTVFIASRHDSHARYIVSALNHRKHVFVEKPLALTPDELEEIEHAYRNAAADGIVLMVGFNRRYSPALQHIANFFSSVSEPLLILYRVHAGLLSPDHWLLQPDQGGRIIGEACHFIDTMAFLTQSLVQSVTARRTQLDRSDVPEDENITATLQFRNGATGTLLYVVTGNRSTPKEYVEVFGGGQTAILNNFTLLQLFGHRKQRRKLNGQKGHREEIEHFLAVVQGKATPLFSFESFLNTTRTTFAIRTALQTGERIMVETQVKNDIKE